MHGMTYSVNKRKHLRLRELLLKYILRFSELLSINTNTNLSAQQELETGSDAANCEVKCNYGLVSKARHEAYIYQQC